MYSPVICTPVRVRICVSSNPDPDYLILAFIPKDPRLKHSPEVSVPRENIIEPQKNHIHLRTEIPLFFESV